MHRGLACSFLGVLGKIKSISSRAKFKILKISVPIHKVLIDDLYTKIWIGFEKVARNS